MELTTDIKWPSSLPSLPQALPMTEYTAFPLMQQLQDALTSDPLYCSGVLEVPPNSFELYYGRKEARCVIRNV